MGALGGLNQTLLRKILAYSSINHIGWILAALLLGPNLLFTYILIYSIVSSSVVLLLNANQIFHFKQIGSIPNTKTKAIAFIRLFSLGGLPPFLGFIPKLLVINLLSHAQELVWLFFLLSRSLITLFYYTRIILTTLTLSSPKLKFAFKGKPDISTYIIRFANFTPLLFPLLSFYQI